MFKDKNRYNSLNIDYFELGLVPLNRKFNKLSNGAIFVVQILRFKNVMGVLKKLVKTSFAIFVNPLYLIYY